MHVQDSIVSISNCVTAHACTCTFKLKDQPWSESKILKTGTHFKCDYSCDTLKCGHTAAWM